jgi:hypothetical protein
MTRDFLNSFRLSMQAHVRLIAALDKSIPCWPETNHKLRHIDGSIAQFDFALAVVVREAGGHISVTEAYRRLSQRTGWSHHRLTIENFLRMLRSIECAVIEFNEPEVPIARLRAWNGENLRAQIRTEAIPFFSPTSIFREHSAIGPR